MRFQMTGRMTKVESVTFKGRDGEANEARLKLSMTIIDEDLQEGSRMFVKEEREAVQALSSLGAKLKEEEGANTTVLKIKRSNKTAVWTFKVGKSNIIHSGDIALTPSVHIVDGGRELKYSLDIKCTAEECGSVADLNGRTIPVTVQAVQMDVEDLRIVDGNAA